MNNQIGWDGRQAAVQGIVGALNRRMDQIILDEALASASGKTVASGSDNLNVGHFADAARLLGSAVPEVNRHILCHDNGFYHFIREGDVKDIDTNIHKPLSDGKLPYYMGFKIHKMGNRDAVVVGDGAGGLPLSGSDRTNYAWHKDSIGLAVNMQPEIEINYIPEKKAHFIAGCLSAGAVLLQDDGVVTITTSEA